MHDPLNLFNLPFALGFTLNRANDYRDGDWDATYFKDNEQHIQIYGRKSGVSYSFNYSRTLRTEMMLDVSSMYDVLNVMESRGFPARQILRNSKIDNFLK